MVLQPLLNGNYKCPSKVIFNMFINAAGVLFKICTRNVETSDKNNNKMRPQF